MQTRAIKSHVPNLLVSHSNAMSAGPGKNLFVHKELYLSSGKGAQKLQKVSLLHQTRAF